MEINWNPHIMRRKSSSNGNALGYAEQWESDTHVVNQVKSHQGMFSFTDKTNHKLTYFINCGRQYVEDNYDQRSTFYKYAYVPSNIEVVLRRKTI
jgi:hypothetical protein